MSPYTAYELCQPFCMPLPRTTGELVEPPRQVLDMGSICRISSFGYFFHCTAVAHQLIITSLGRPTCQVFLANRKLTKTPWRCWALCPTIVPWSGCPRSGLIIHEGRQVRAITMVCFCLPSSFSTMFFMGSDLTIYLASCLPYVVNFTNVDRDRRTRPFHDSKQNSYDQTL